MHKLLLAFVFVVSFSAFTVVNAQTTIFNAPSTDTIEKGRSNIELDYIVNPKSYRNGGYQTFGYRYVYGIDHKTEVGANFFYTRDGYNSPKELGFNVKRKLYENEKHGIGSSVGALVSVPLNRSAGKKVSTLVYANVSKVVKQTRGTRVTVGAYKVFGGDADYGKKYGVILGIEQPITKRLTFLGDWYSGRNRYGYAFAGFSIAVTKRQFFFLGYNFGNAGHGDQSWSFAYGITF